MATILDFWKKKPSKSSNTTEKHMRLSSSSSSESFTFNLDVEWFLISVCLIHFQIVCSIPSPIINKLDDDFFKN